MAVGSGGEHAAVSSLAARRLFGDGWPSWFSPSRGRAIGERLFVGESTVKTHLLHVFAKLDVADRTRAVTRAMELGIL